MTYAKYAAAWCLRTLGWWLIEWGYRMDGGRAGDGEG